LAAGRIEKEALSDAVRLAGCIPSPARWRRFLDALTLWIGSVFLAAAVIFFFAFNWRALDRFSRFGTVEGLLVLAVLVAWRKGLERTSGKAALLMATMLTGGLLALEGQTYQSGADPWELFALWAICTLPWAAIARFPALWLVWLALVNVACTLYYCTITPNNVLSMLRMLEFDTLLWVLAAVNTLSLAVWETGYCRGVSWLTDRWPPRLMVTASAACFTTLAVKGICSGYGSAGSALYQIPAYLLWLAQAHTVYRRKLPDLYVLALGVLSLIIVLTVLLCQNIFSHSFQSGALLMVAIMVLGLSAAGGWWLRQVAREEQA
jgi:uncharacterized membrane protein